MRKILLLLFAIFMLASCGPHRMGCGARGICKAPHHLKSLNIKEQNTVYVNWN